MDFVQPFFFCVCVYRIDKFVTEASRLVTRCRMDEIEKGIGCIGTIFS